MEFVESSQEKEGYIWLISNFKMSMDGFIQPTLSSTCNNWDT